jgi:putative ABC transport system permease protein
LGHSSAADAYSASQKRHFFTEKELAVLSLRNGPMGSGAASQPMFSAWKGLELLGAVEGAATERSLVEGDGGGAAATVARVSPGLLTLLGGVHPIAGRLFAADETSGRVLIGEALWETMFTRRVDIIGQTIRIDGERLEIVGVLPAAFRFPTRGTAIWRATDFSDPRTTQRPIVYVRLAADARRPLALDAATIAARSAAPQYSERWHAEAEPLSDYLGDRYYRRAVPLLAGGVALLCIVLATNAAGLMLLAVLACRREVAISQALGASRGRMLADSAAETLLTCLGSIAGGLLISVLLVELCRTTLDAASLMRGLNTIELGSRAVFVAFAFGFATSVIVGMSVWFAARVDGKAPDFGQLRASGAMGTAGGHTTRAREVLVLAQVSLVTFLGFTALLLVRSFATLSAIDPGFDPAGMQVAHVAFPAAAFPSEELRLQAARSLRAEAEAIPGVGGVTWSYGTPPGGGITDTGLWTPLDSAGPSKEFSAHRVYVEPEGRVRNFVCEA